MTARGNEALFAVYEWKNEDIGMDVYHELMRRSKLFRYENIHLYIFAKRMFTGELIRTEHDNGLVALFTLSEMVNGMGDVG